MGAAGSIVLDPAPGNVGDKFDASAASDRAQYMALVETDQGRPIVLEAREVVAALSRGVVPLPAPVYRPPRSDSTTSDPRPTIRGEPPGFMGGGTGVLPFASSATSTRITRRSKTVGIETKQLLRDLATHTAV
jgi:hypothetical protein